MTLTCEFQLLLVKNKKITHLVIRLILFKIFFEGTKPFRGEVNNVDDLRSIPEIDRPPDYQICALGRSLTKIDQGNNVPGVENEFLPEYPFYEFTKTE